MRLLTVLALAAVAALLASQLQATAASPTKAVEVSNFPDPQNVVGAVEVTNLPGPPPRFQLVGFTATGLTGDAGVLGFTLECRRSLPGAGCVRAWR